MEWGSEPVSRPLLVVAHVGCGLACGPPEVMRLWDHVWKMRIFFTVTGGGVTMIVFVYDNDYGHVNGNDSGYGYDYDSGYGHSYGNDYGQCQMAKWLRLWRGR
jgi:hypothetical protein